MTRLNRAFRQDTSLAEHRYLAIVSAADLERLREASLEAWHRFAREATVPSDPGERRELFQSWSQAAGLDSPPWLEGLELVHLEPSQEATALWRGRTSPLVHKLLELAPTGEQPHILRWLPPTRLSGYLGGRPEVFVSEQPLYAHELLVLPADGRRFAALLGDTPLAPLALVARPVPERFEARPAPSGAPVLAGLAVSVAATFNVPNDSMGLIKNMLAGLLGPQGGARAGR